MMTLEKLNLQKAYPEYYNAVTKAKIVNLEPSNYITLSGICAPEDPKFLKAIEDLYGLAYHIKFISKGNDLDFVVPKMEGFWWVTGDLPFEETARNDWHWKIIFRMPDFVGKSEYNEAINQMIEKGKATNEHDYVFEEIHEGLSAQILHIGSYDNERETLNQLYQFIEREGFKISGYHHEIYLSDPRKTSEEKLKTILRYAIQ
ncbi:GyrI-like domain-containing protein [Roseivirga sp.]|uniref:GyrI-like domain-containing protein n=1 Tax=Roseivirga sp. TaxID=1964215 RepID=UPI003B8AEF73